MDYTLIAFILASACPQTLMTNKTKYPWNDWDRSRMAYCQKKCPSEYDDSPCLKKFIKIGKRDFYCECGKP